MRVVSGPESSLGGWGRTARRPTRLGPSPENTTSRSGCSARERAACARARLKTSVELSLWGMALKLIARATAALKKKAGEDAWLGYRATLARVVSRRA